MERVYTLGVIGCGDIATTQHLPAIADNPRVRLAAVCDVNEARAAATGRRFGASRSLREYQALAQDPAIDAVVVATPPWVTPHITMAALRAGKDVLCEKPMATSLEVARQVAAVERETARLVQVGFTYRHGPLMEALRGWIAAGRLGRPLVVRMGIFDEVYDPHGNPEHYARMLATLRHGPPCLHDGAHSADHLHFLTGSRAVRVSAWGLTSRPEFPAPNYNAAAIELANGDRATLEIGWLYPHFPRGEFEVLGPLGLAVFDRPHREAVLVSGRVVERVQLDEDWVRSCFRLQLEAFVRALDERRRPVPGTREGIASLGLCQAIVAAMARRAPVEIAEEGTVTMASHEVMSP